MDCTNKINDPLSTSQFQVVWLPVKTEPNEKKGPFLDVDLCNLKRAYNVPLESQDSLSYSNEEDLKSDNDMSIEKDNVDQHDSLELCESQTVNETGDVNISQNNDHEYRCCSCSFVGTILQLHNHIKYCHPNELRGTNWCKYCQVNFENKTVFKKHQEQEHMFCSACSKTFTKRKLLLAHLLWHSSEEEKFKCLDCRRVLTASCYFVSHLETHEKNSDNEEEVKEQVLKCTMCQKVFSNKVSLAKHVKIHSRELLKCSLCDFTCKEKITLKMHFISHEGNRKYKCSNCDFSFKQIGHLKRHNARFNH